MDIAHSRRFWTLWGEGAGRLPIDSGPWHDTAIRRVCTLQSPGLCRGAVGIGVGRHSGRWGTG